jgi:teichuronic acid biosynthesis glycosyltransferase TuaH
VSTGRPADEQPRDVIFTFAYASWQTVVDRGMCFPEDRLAQTLLEHPRVGKLMVVETPRSLPIRLVKDLLRPPPPFPATRDASLFSPARLRRGDPRGVHALERTYGQWERRVRSAAERNGLEHPALISAHPLVAGFANPDWVYSFTYYVYDDWTSVPSFRRLWPAFEEAYRRVRERRHRVAAVSDAIISRIQPLGPHATVPNGVDPAEWLTPGAAPPWFTALPTPRLLYIGSLDARIDVDQVRRAAQTYRTGSVVIVGRLYEPEHFASLRAEPNVHLPGPASREEIVGLVSNAEVCLIPHIRNSLTEAMSPLKLYEYLAGGAPVAALDLPPIRGVDPRIVIADELSDAVADALELGRADEASRRRFAEANSWRRRQDRIVELALAAPTHGS